MIAMGKVSHTMIATTEPELRAALGVARWVTDVTSASPFDSLESLLATAHAAATPLSIEEIDQALAHHPRIGEKPAGEGAAQAFSRSEQSSADASDEAVNTLIAEGNVAYEEKFGRVFLIRAAGRTRAEILAELQRRIQLDDAEEIQIVGEQLCDIALLRLEKMYA